jgi:hypothetical protein
MRTTVGLIVAVALGLQSGVATAQTGDLVEGFGTTEVGSQFDLRVEGSASGANPTGHFSLVGPPNVYSWEATPQCMSVAGDRATLGFFINHGSFGASDVSGYGVLLWIQNHPADHGTAYYKVLSPDVPSDPHPITCADPRPGPDPSFTAIDFFGFTNVADRQPPIPPGSDSVSGSADSGCLAFDPSSFCIFRLLLDVGIASGPGGENPTGAVTVSDLGPTPGGTSYVAAAATCLSVSGRVAIVGVTGSRQRYGSASPHTQIAGLIRIVDGGGPNSGADTFQFALTEGPLSGPPGPGPTTCSTFPGTFPNGGGIQSFTNQTGDVVVTDARPLPTSKNQCKNGGWRAYGVFKNQGDCVSFVATGGKNPSANSP